MQITLKREAACAECGARLPVGSPARWYRNGTIYGVNCHNGNATVKPTDKWAEVIHQANAAARQAYSEYKEEHYKSPQYVVEEHQDMLNDNSPVVKQYPIADLCGFVWIELRLKDGCNRDFISWFKAHGKIQPERGSGRTWQIHGHGLLGGAELCYYPDSGKWSYPWRLHLDGVGHGNCAFGAAIASQRAAGKVLSDAGLEVWCRDRMD